jgi:hypothetical protein
LAETQTSSTGKVIIRVANARVAFAKALALFFPEPVLPAGIHPSAVVARTAQIDAGAYIGPNCVMGERAQIAGGARFCTRGITSATIARSAPRVCCFPTPRFMPARNSAARERSCRGGGRLGWLRLRT